MLHTACATTTTAVNINPWRIVRIVGPGSAGARRAKLYIRIADGNVKPIQAAIAPPHPARCRPTRKPT